MTPLVLAGTGSISSPTLTLNHRVISTNFQVFNDGDGDRFSMTLIAKPWPAVGQRIAFAFNEMSFVGVVTATEAEDERGRGRYIYHVKGKVEHFEAPGLKDA